MKLSRKTWLAVVVFVGVAIGLSALHPLWPDEAFSAKLITYGPARILELTKHDVHPPLYYMVLKAWTSLYGHSEIGMRSLSIALSLLTFATLYRLLKQLKLELPGWVIVLVGFLPFFIRYTVEARMYALGGLELVLSTSLLLDLIRRPNRQRQVLYGLLLVAGFYTQYFALLIVPTHLLIMMWAKRRKGIVGALTELIKTMWLPGVVAAVLIAPWLPILHSQTQGVYDVYWIPRVTWKGLRDAWFDVANYYLVRGSWLNIVGILARIVATVVAVAATVMTIARKNYRPVVLLLPMFVAATIMVILSLPPLKPVFDPRYLALYTPLFYAGVVAAGAKLLPKKYRQIGLALMLFVGVAGVISVGKYFSSDQNSKPAMSYVNSHYRPGDTLVADSIFVYYGSEYYNHTGAPLKIQAMHPIKYSRESAPIFADRELLAVENYNQLHGRIWLIAHPGEVAGIPTAWTKCGDGGDSQVQATCYLAE